MALDFDNKGNLKRREPPEEKENYNALCVGVGGTGVIRASIILGWAAPKDGFKVRNAETHGMSQRGGSVSSYLRFGKSLESPFMIEGGLDVLIGFEIFEALRNLNYANKDTLIIVSRNSVIPPSVLTHNTLKIDMNRCVGCDNCLAHCLPNEVYLESQQKHPFTLMKGPTRRVVDGHTRVLESCTSYSKCIIDNVCPFDVIEAYNESIY